MFYSTYLKHFKHTWLLIKNLLHYFWCHSSIIVAELFGVLGVHLFCAVFNCTHFSSYIYIYSIYHGIFSKIFHRFYSNFSKAFQSITERYNEYEEYTRKRVKYEEWTNFITHVVCIPFALYAHFQLQLHAITYHQIVVLTLYSALMISMFVCSSIYHLSSVLGTIITNKKLRYTDDVLCFWLFTQIRLDVLEVRLKFRWRIKETQRIFSRITKSSN